MILKYVVGLGLGLRGQSPHPACSTRHRATRLSSQHWGGGSRRTGRSGHSQLHSPRPAWATGDVSELFVCCFKGKKKESTCGWETSLGGRKLLSYGWLLTAQLCRYRSAFKCARWPYEITKVSLSFALGLGFFLSSSFFFFKLPELSWGEVVHTQVDLCKF